MLQNPCKTFGFKKNMVYKIPLGGGKPYPASGLLFKHAQDQVWCPDITIPIDWDVKQQNTQTKQTNKRSPCESSAQSIKHCANQQSKNWYDVRYSSFNIQI